MPHSTASHFSRGVWRVATCDPQFCRVPFCYLIAQWMQSKGDLLPSALFQVYVRYARTYVHPKLSDEAAAAIKDFYLALRRQNNPYSGALPVTTRQLEALIRMSQVSHPPAHERGGSLGFSPLPPSPSPDPIGLFGTRRVATTVGVSCSRLGDARPLPFFSAPKSSFGEPTRLSFHDWFSMAQSWSPPVLLQLLAPFHPPTHQ